MGSYTVVLNKEPASTATVSVSAGGDLTVSPSSLTSTTLSDWNVPPWVTVTAGWDMDPLDETETVTHTATSTDSSYDGIEIASVRVAITDRGKKPADDPTGTLSASPNPCTITAGDTCSTTLSWTSTNTSAIQIRLITTTMNKVVATKSGTDASEGKMVVDEIGLTDSTFYLYEYLTDLGRRGKQLAVVSVHGVEAPSTSITPTSGPVGTSVTIGGSEFGANAGTVAFGGTAASTTSWSDTRIVAVVPAGLASGAVTVTVTPDGTVTAITIGTFTVTEPPEPPEPPDPLPDPPVIDSFTASPLMVNLEDKITLSWKVRGAKGLSIDQGVGSVTPPDNGSKGNVSPKDTDTSTTYTLTASDGTGSCTATAGPVAIKAPTISCSASPALVDPGGTSTLTWSAASVKSVSADQGIGSGLAFSGTKDVTPSSKTDYKFTATGSAGRTASCTVTVKVRPKIKSFTATPSSIKRGETSTLAWETENATTVTLGGSTVTATGSSSVQPWDAEDHDYTLSASNADASVSATATVTVSLPPAPQIGILNPTSGVPESRVTLLGSNFSSTHRGSVSFGGSSAEIVSWGASSVTVLVPGHLGRGPTSVSLTVLGQTSNSVNFEVTGDPVRSDCPEGEEDCEDDEEKCDEDDKDCDEEEDDGNGSDP